MFYVGQRIEHKNSGAVHTIQCFQGGGIKLLGQGNTCHPLNLFKPHVDDGLFEIFEYNNDVIGKTQGKRGNYCSLFFGLSNEDEIEFIVRTMIKGGCVLSMVAVVDGRYAPGTWKQALMVDVDYPSFAVVFNVTQNIISELGLGAAKMHDDFKGAYLVITAGRFKLRGEIYIVGTPRDGDLKFVKHGGQWVAINMD